MDKIIIDKKYIRKKFISKGLTSKVYTVEEIKKEKIYAGKIYNDDRYYYNEVEILNKLKEKQIPNIVNLIDNGDGDIIKGYSFQKKKYLILEYAEKGDLSKYITICGKGLKEINAKLFFSKILKSVQLINKTGICHRDLKTGNILLDNKFNPKICDFGFAAYTTTKLKDTLGTYCYAAPEIYNSYYDGEKIDIFSLGVVLFNIVTGVYSFQKAKITDNSYRLIKDKNYKVFWEKLTQVKNVSDQFKQLFEKMVAYKPVERPSIEQILKSEWMKEINEKNEEEINNLEIELYEDFLEREKDVKDSSEEEHEVISDSLSSSGISESYRGTGNNEKEYFNNDLIPKKIKEEKTFEFYIKLKGNVNPIKFMNKYINIIKQKSEDENEKNEYICQNLDINNKKLEFKAFFESEGNDDESNEEIEENEDKDLNKELNEENENDNIKEKEIIIKIKLYECKDGYLLVFQRLSGEKDDFYKILKNLYSYVKQI